MDLYEDKEMIEEVDQEEEPLVQDHPLFVANTIIDIHSQMEGSQAARGNKAHGTDWVMYGMCLLMGGYLVADSIINDHWQKNAIFVVLRCAEPFWHAFRYINYVHKLHPSIELIQ